MGVRGLTSFIQQNSSSCMTNYELHDTSLVIDGDSIAYQLYCQHLSPKNCCFTGDYDRYGDVIKSFFKVLLECNVKPIIIFDGGYENRKMETVMKRMGERIKLGGTLDSVSTDIVFPLFLGELFKDIAVEFKFPVIRCDYEGDSESANIAKSINCPILSNDSDFYIFDVMYIPFYSFKMQALGKISALDRAKNYLYISCELYKTDRFLAFIELEKYQLPLFATLMGNDYIDRTDLTPYFKRYCYSRKLGYINELALWLRGQSNETAIKKVLMLCRSSEKDQIEQSILESMTGYKCKNSKYMCYIYSERKYFECDEKHLNNVDETGKTVMEVFLNNSRKCLYHSCFINMLMQNTYYIRPQVDDHSLNCSHTISIEIIGAINKILKNSREKLRFYSRIQSELNEQSIPPCSINIPSFLEIQALNVKAREKLLLRILHVNDSFIRDTLDCFPDSWRLYIVCIKYLCQKFAINWSFIHALVLCKILLEYVDKKIEFIRNSQEFISKYRQEVCKILIDRNNSNKVNVSADSICSVIDMISYEDSLIAQKNLISFYEMKPELARDARSFNRKIVHAASQFQSCFYHLCFLNNLLKSPFEACPMSKCFNGTFIYNMTCELRNRFDENYIPFLLQNSSSVLSCFNLMIENLKLHIDVPFMPANKGFNV